MKFANFYVPVREENKPRILPESGGGRTSERLYCRDPFILPYDGKYYLYHRSADDGRHGILCSVSADLEHWSRPITVFAPPEGFHGVKDCFWAPECHYFEGCFYIFTSVFSSIYGRRVISVYRADNPLGPFEDIAGGCITPPEWDAIDGTLYVDDEGQPWMVFVHEWVSMPEGNGGMCAVRLSRDLTHFEGEITQLFLARDVSWATMGVTDGPFLYRTKGGPLLMLWSNFSKKGYVVALARSESGSLLGPWTHADRLLYQKELRPDFTTDGGHAMIFRTHEGQTMISLHSPNAASESNFEHLMLFPLKEENGMIEIA
ncbi:MAG: family 43 glycosylhydrolase [Clostridia bacterium]|nr:family 43 glycosylhydrolase [Clostridia bacterium]